VEDELSSPQASHKILNMPFVWSGDSAVVNVDSNHDVFLEKQAFVIRRLLELCVKDSTY
jgi:hypothetical protein